MCSRCTFFWGLKADVLTSQEFALPVLVLLFGLQFPPPDEKHAREVEQKFNCPIRRLFVVVVFFVCFFKMTFLLLIKHS